MDNVTMGKSPESVTPGNEKPAKTTCQWCGFARTNAYLLNAAPDMYAVLSEIDSVGFFDWDTFGPKIAAALAKAEGRA